MTVSMIQSSFAQKAKYQSIFIYNFSRYIKWPDHMNTGDFVIGVLGDKELYTHLSNMSANKRQTQGMALKVVNYNSIAEVEKCHILVVASRFSSQISGISSNANLSNSAIVTNGEGLAKKGSTINFIEKDGKIKFELNQDDANKRGLKVSSSLLSLAILV